MDAEERVNWVYASQTNQELATRYDDWAGSYERDLLESFGYTAPQETIAHFAKYASSEDEDGDGDCARIPGPLR